VSPLFGHEDAGGLGDAGNVGIFLILTPPSPLFWWNGWAGHQLREIRRQ